MEPEQNLYGMRVNGRRTTDIPVGNAVIVVSSVDASYLNHGGRIYETAVIWPDGRIDIEGGYDDHDAVVAKLMHA